MWQTVSLQKQQEQLWSQSPFHACESPLAGGAQAQPHILPEGVCRAVACWSCKVSQAASTRTLSQGKHEGKWHVEEIQPSLSCALSEWTEISHRIFAHSLPWSWTVKLHICLETRKKKRSSAPWAWDRCGPEKLSEVPLHSVPVTSAYLNTNFCSLFPGFLLLKQSRFHLGPSKPHPP